MTDDLTPVTPRFPYATHLNVLYPALTLIDLDPLVAEVRDAWYNQTLTRVNDSVVRLGVMEGEYHWHHHEADDEFFFVLSGRFLIDLEPADDGITPGRVVELGPRQGLTVPRGGPSDEGARAERDPDDRDRGDRPDRQLRLVGRTSGDATRRTAGVNRPVSPRPAPADARRQRRPPRSCPGPLQAR